MDEFEKYEVKHWQWAVTIIVIFILIILGIIIFSGNSDKNITCKQERNYYWLDSSLNKVFVGTDLLEARIMSGSLPLSFEEKCKK